MSLLAEMNLGQWALAFLVVCVCLFMILVILLQRGRGGGIAGAFGGSGGSGAFGAKTGDVFTWITVAFAGVFLLLAIAGNFVFRPTSLAFADPATAGAGPGGPAEGQTITLTPDGVVGGEGIQVEMVTPDGQTLPAQVVPGQTPDGAQPQQPAQEGTAPQQPAAQPAPTGDEPPPADPSAQPAGNDNTGNTDPGTEQAEETGPGRG